jgi:hypothetical protein
MQHEGIAMLFEPLWPTMTLYDGTGGRIYAASLF